MSKLTFFVRFDKSVFISLLSVVFFWSINDSQMSDCSFSSIVDQKRAIISKLELLRSNIWIKDRWFLKSVYLLVTQYTDRLQNCVGSQRSRSHAFLATRKIYWIEAILINLLIWTQCLSKWVCKICIKISQHFVITKTVRAFITT